MADNLFEQAKYERTEVYLEDRYEKPKYLFTVLGDKLQGLIAGKAGSSLLDVGSASGEFAYYVKSRFPQLDITCLEYDRVLHERAQARVKNCRFVQGDANHMAMFAEKQFAFTTMIGVLSIFDDFQPSLHECIRVTADRGAVIIVTQFNEYPVDALIRWRYSGDQGQFNPGLNLFSKKSIAEFLRHQKRVDKWEFEKFVLPFDLPKQTDVIRTWTEFGADGNRILKNGLQMEINLHILTIILTRT